MTKTFCNKCGDKLDTPILTLTWPAKTVHLCARCTRNLGQWLGVRL